METAELVREREVEAIKVDFKRGGFDQEIVSVIASWGELKQHNDGFILEIKEEGNEDKGIRVEYHYGPDAPLELERFYKSENGISLTEAYFFGHGFTKIFLEEGKTQVISMRGAFCFEADFGTIGSIIARVNKKAEFDVASSVGNVRS